MPKPRGDRKTGATDPRTIANREKALQALELRKAGVGYDAIAAKLGYAGRSGAYKAVAKLLTSVEREAATELLEIELQRLDDMLRAVWGNARAGRVAHVDRVLKIIERRAKLLGMDKDRTEISGPNGGPIETTHGGVVLLPPEDNGET